MDSEQNIASHVCTISDNNLEAVLFSEFPGTENMIMTSDGVNNLSELEGTLCYDETTNELVYVNMIQSNLGAPDSLSSTSQSVFAALRGVSTLTEASTFNDGNSIMLLANGSIVIPSNNDDDLAVAAHTDSLFLQYVPNPPNVPMRESSKCIETIVDKPPDPVSNCGESGDGNDAIASVADMRERCKNTDADDVLDNLELNYRCELCAMTFSRKKDYRTHLASHKDEVHKCSHCGSSFNKMKNLILHEALHNPTDTICPLSNCQKKFRRLASLKAHLKLHEEEETLTCTKCGEEFRNQMCLELHYKCLPQCRSSTIDVHDSLKNAQKGASKLCKLCNRRFQDLSAFIAHKKEHEKIKKALASKSHRKKTSSSSKPSSRMNRCKECPKWFLKPSQLVRHMRIHTGERPYECTECNKAFNQANSLKIHMLKHTGDRPYLCQFCNSGFSQRGNLRQHINRVHSIPKVEDLVYECAECPCRFKKICSLNAHRNRVHRKGYKLVLSSDDVENEMLYLSGQQESSEPASIEEGGQNELMADSSGNKIVDHMYMCPECTSTFKTISALKNHLNEVHVQLQIPQDEGENSITLENDLDDLDEEEVKSLLKKRTTVNTIMIAVDRGCGELWNQKVFIKKSGNRQLYQCSHCSKESTKLNEMIRHTKINVMGKLFKCDYCQKTFSQHSTFKTHLLLHATAKTYHCQVCQRKFTNPAELNAHSKSHPPMNDDVLCLTCLRTYSSAEREKHECLPPRTFFDLAMDGLAQITNDVQHVHDKANLILPPYICTRCNKTFKSYGKLKSHLRNHDEEIIMPCNSRSKSPERLPEAGALVNAESLQCDELLDDSSHLVWHQRKSAAATTSQAENESVLCPIDNVSSTLASFGTDDAANDISDFVMTENPSMNLNVHVDLSLKTDNFATNKTCMESTSRTEDNVQMAKYEDIIMQNDTNESKKNDVTYTITTDQLGDCFLDSQVTTLPVEGTVTQTESMFTMPADIIYKCTSCNEQYTTELDLQKHFQESQTCNNGIPDMTLHYFYACNTCYLTFKSLTSFLKHLQTHNGSETYTCIYCDRPNKTEAELTQHIAAHALKKEYPCVHCGELAETAEAVKKHITDVHLMSSADSKALETKRKKTISSELLLTEKEKLMLVDHKPNKYSSISEKVLSSLLKKTVKKDGGTEEVSDETEIPLKTKKKRANLSTKENKCNYCDRSFKKMCDLIRHIRIHTGEKPFKCDYCNKCFTVKSILNCHLKTHFTVKNIFCHICNRFFSTVGSLKIHMRLHTGDRPYECLYCKESFRTSGHRDSHQKRHLGEKDKTRMVTIEAAMAELGNQENLDASLSEMMNLQDSNYLISKITDIEDFKFQDSASNLDLVSVDSFSNTNDCVARKKSFKKRDDLEKHLSVQRTGDVRFSELNSPEAHVKQLAPSVVHCDVCQKTFASAKSLKIHKIRQHADALELPFQDDNESFLLLGVDDKSSVAESSSTSVFIDNTNNRDKSKWSEPKDVNLSVLVGKNKKTDALGDFFIMEKQFDLNSMISDFFPDA